MKTNLIFVIIFMIVLTFFTSCDPNTLNDPSIYWNTNTLTRAQLKGSVKMVTFINESGTKVDQFNSDGFITGSTYTDNGLTITDVYNYDSGGKLISAVRTTFGGKDGTYANNFEYQNIGKYVLKNKYRLLHDALVPNLKGQTIGQSQTKYEFEGDLLNLLESNDMGISFDTTKVLYSGNYPSTITYSDGTVFNNFVYDTYGKFLNYTKFYQNETYSNECRYYFRPDDQYLMLDSMIQTSIQGATRIDKEIYTYNSNKDVEIFSNYMGDYQYTYTYDSHQNWLTKSTEYRPDSNQVWGFPTIETRTINYW